MSLNFRLKIKHLFLVNKFLVDQLHMLLYGVQNKPLLESFITLRLATRVMKIGTSQNHPMVFIFRFLYIITITVYIACI